MLFYFRIGLGDTLYWIGGYRDRHHGHWITPSYLLIFTWKSLPRHIKSERAFRWKITMALRRYQPEMRQQAIRMYLDGLNFRRIGRLLSVHHTSVLNWVNAELRHYLARSGRRSRCFNRCIHALRRAVKLFVFAFNRRQLALRRFPAYPLPVIDFVYP